MKPRATPTIGASVAAALLLALAPPARAWVQSVTGLGTPTRWNHSCLPLRLYAGEPAGLLDRATLVGATQAAAATWSADAVSCTKLRLTVDITEEPSADVAFDKVNRITFRRALWAKQPCDPAKEDCTLYDPRALALTSVFADKRTGQIVDADIELNAVTFVWADVRTQGGPSSQDLQNTLTHELGHLIGLDHNCYLPSLLPRLQDHEGHLVPDCADATAEQREATMFASARAGDVSKRDLAADDSAGVCGLYPAQGALTCAEPPPTPPEGCALGRGPASPGGPAGALALMALALLARRRRR